MVDCQSPVTSSGVMKVSKVEADSDSLVGSCEVGIVSKNLVDASSVSVFFPSVVVSSSSVAVGVKSTVDISSVRISVTVSVVSYSSGFEVVSCTDNVVSSGSVVFSLYNIVVIEKDSEVVVEKAASSPAINCEVDSKDSGVEGTRNVVCELVVSVCVASAVGKYETTSSVEEGISRACSVVGRYVTGSRAVEGGAVGLVYVQSSSSGPTIRHSQNEPVRSGGQEHENWSTPSKHVPPFIHL